MSWVSFLRAVETASGAADLGSHLNERSASFTVLLSALRDSSSIPTAPERSELLRDLAPHSNRVVIVASSYSLVSPVIPSEEVHRPFRIPVGKLLGRAGIE